MTSALVVDHQKYAEDFHFGQNGTAKYQNIKQK